MKLETLSNDELAMIIAMITSRMSQDPHTQVGSCIIGENGEFLSVGYNKVPKNWKGDFPWARNSDEVGVENTKYPYVIHSEANALNNYRGLKEKLENATIYVTLFPCQNCAKQIVESGIKKVVYKDDFYKDSIDNQCSKRLLMQCGVEFIQFSELSKINECGVPLEKKMKIHF